MKKLLASLLLLCGSLSAYPQHSPALNGPMYAAYRLDEVKQLIAQVETEGAISVQFKNLGANSSNAAWSPEERIIFINTAKQPTQGRMIRSIIFELHNALSNPVFLYYDLLAQNGKLSKSEYIEIIERLEYNNVCKANTILQKGIQLGIFPHDAQYSVPPTFEEHFYIQKQTGHAGFIGGVYDLLGRRAMAQAHYGYAPQPG